MNKSLVIRPVLIERTRGGWLAVSQAGSELRIGVVGDTEKQARQRFADALKKWAKLLDEPGSAP